MPTKQLDLQDRSIATPNEHEVQNAILRALARSDLRAWRNNTGKAIPIATVRRMLCEVAAGKSPEAALTGARLLSFGIDGQADITGILGPEFGTYEGCRLEVEVKSKTGRLREEQKNFKAMISAMGGLAVVARSADEVLNALAAAKVSGGGTIKAGE